MKTLLILILCCVSLSALAQTDIIEMRSRNASLKKYERISKIKSHDHVASNFGMLMNPDVRTAVLDSVKAISDSVTVMYTSNYCTRGGQPQLNIEFYIDSNGVQQYREKPERAYPNPRVGSLWQPGADTVFHHPLFRHTHSLDSVKTELDNYYYFNLPSDSIEFIGFDNAHGISNEDAVQPVKHKRKGSKKNTIGWELLLMIITPVLFMLGVNRFTLFKPISTK